MTKRELTNKKKILRWFGLLAAGIITCSIANHAAAQSTDLDRPTPLTASEASGGWPGNKATSYFYSFEAGPGQVMLMLDFAADHDIQNVSGELTDSYGRGFANLDDDQNRSELSYFTTPKGLRLVGRYELKRRQKLVVRVSSEGDPGEVVPGKYKIRVEGSGVAFSAGSTSPAASNGGGPTIDMGVSCLPKIGRLRLVMNDGTVQEINLRSVREASIKP